MAFIKHWNKQLSSVPHCIAIQSQNYVLWLFSCTHTLIFLMMFLLDILQRWSFYCQHYWWNVQRLLWKYLELQNWSELKKVLIYFHMNYYYFFYFWYVPHHFCNQPHNLKNHLWLCHLVVSIVRWITCWSLKAEKSFIVTNLAFLVKNVWPFKNRF